MNEFKPNKIELSVWGSREAIERGRENGARRVKQRVWCSVCFKSCMNIRDFKEHRRVSLACVKARGEMK